MKYNHLEIEKNGRNTGKRIRRSKLLNLINSINQKINITFSICSLIQAVTGFTWVILKDIPQPILSPDIKECVGLMCFTQWAGTLSDYRLEQFAIKTGIHPKIRTEECIARFKKQMNSIGFAYDWDREVNTSDKDFFRWTQWIF